jgi:hypothetical protein
LAGEVVSTVLVAYNDGLSNASGWVSGRLTTSAGKRQTKLVQNVGLAPEAVQLGEITAPGVIFLKNLDDTNSISILNETGGKAVATLKPDLLGNGNGGYFAIDCAGADMQAPFAASLVAPCRMEVLIIDA